MDRNDILKIIRKREGGAVQRCHCFPHHNSYSVAEHSFNMLLLLDDLHPNPSRELKKAILLHDLFERWTGDCPAAVKKITPDIKKSFKDAEVIIENLSGIELPEMTSDEKAWIKALDNLEFLMWCDDQIGLGSKVAEIKRLEVEEDLFGRFWDNLPTEIKTFLRLYKWQRTTDDLA